MIVSNGKWPVLFLHRIHNCALETLALYRTLKKRVLRWFILCQTFFLFFYVWEGPDARPRKGFPCYSHFNVGASSGPTPDSAPCCSSYPTDIHQFFSDGFFPAGSAVVLPEDSVFVTRILIWWIQLLTYYFFFCCLPACNYAFKSGH